MNHLNMTLPHVYNDITVNTCSLEGKIVILEN